MEAGQGDWKSLMSSEDRVKVCKHILSKLAGTFSTLDHLFPPHTHILLLTYVMCTFNNSILRPSEP